GSRTGDIQRARIARGGAAVHRGGGGRRRETFFTQRCEGSRRRGLQVGKGRGGPCAFATRGAAAETPSRRKKSMKSPTIRALVPGMLALVSLSACSDAGVGTETDAYGVQTAALTGCSIDNAVPLTGPNQSNRVGSNACVAVIPPMLPSWWQYSDGTLRVQIANFDDQDPNENAFP